MASRFFVSILSPLRVGHSSASHFVFRGGSLEQTSTQFWPRCDAFRILALLSNYPTGGSKSDPTSHRSSCGSSLRSRPHLQGSVLRLLHQENRAGPRLGPPGNRHHANERYASTVVLIKYFLTVTYNIITT